jgi:glycosyltransferase involved in cell wall biosynthesis
VTARCDLHLHSSASTHSEEWVPRQFGCPESFAEPRRQYELCKARGMTFVTLTDHDTIAGGLQLLDRPDFFLSEEVTARFPENDCVAHVLAWNISPEQHERIQEVCGDVYALVDYLRVAEIAHGLAHPLESPNRKLDAATLEKMTLLFSTFEVVNGRSEERLNAGIRKLLRDLDARALKRLSARHSLAPAHGVRRRAGVSAGSDDHEHPRAAACFTEVAAAATPAELLTAVMAGEARAVGSGIGVVDLGLAFGTTTFRFLETLAADGQAIESPFADVMNAIRGQTDPARAKSRGQAEFLAHLGRVVAEARAADSRCDVARVAAGETEQAGAIADAQIRVADALLRSGAEAALDAATGADFYGLFAAERDVAAAVKAMAPYLFAANHLGRQLDDLRELGRGWTVTPWPEASPRLAIFADTLSQIDGVSIWCRRFLTEAARDGREVVVPHCGPVSEAVRDEATASFFEELPELAGGAVPGYAGLRFTIPSLVHTIAWMQRRGVTEVELATPGPFGLVGLLAAKLLRLPVRATYHTEVPQLVGLLTGSERLEGWACHFVRWFYAQVDRVTVFSRAAHDRLRALGIAEARLDLAALTVDPTDFSPSHGERQAPLGFDLPADRPIILSVGRLSPEKNLPLVIEATAALGDLEPRPLLVIVGDGPERARLEALAARHEHVRFLGARRGAELRKLYARASAFAFASELDTLGLVALEAMASGAPLVVARSASVAGTVEHRRSAYLYDLDPDGLEAALREVLTNRDLAAALARNGRAEMVARWQAAHPAASATPARAR